MEKTFTSYTKEQSDRYDKARRDYDPSVYNTVLNQHASTGGEHDLVVDVGCGPGRATRNLAQHFTHAIGLDPSPNMIVKARETGGVSSSSEPIRWENSPAEELGQNLEPPIKDSSVDLITAANAAHWFDMEKFWIRAARVLKPGGSVALWMSGTIRADPNHIAPEAIQQAFDEHEEKYLKPFYEPGNFHTRNRYNDLPLPWTMKEPVTEFDKDAFFRKDWTMDEQFVSGDLEVGMDMFEMIMGTASQVTRWRQANPDAVGEDDVVRILRRKIEKVLHDAGVEKGKERVKGTTLGSVLVIKKRKL